MFLNANPVLRVSDYPRAKAFYTDALGFTCMEEGGEPAQFGIYRRDRCQLFLNAFNGADAPYAHWRAYFHVTEIDALVAEFRAKGAEPSKDLWLTVYEMREFEVTDPDGNVICFGADP